MRLSVSMTVPNAEISLINLRQGQLTLELFIQIDGPRTSEFPLPEHAGLRHLAFKWTM